MKQRAGIVIKGAVQGIGFRPFIYRLASELNIKGYVNNTNAGVFIEAEGEHEIVNEFLARIEKEKPGHSFIEEILITLLKPKDYTKFEILTNCFDGEPDTIILPDLGICNACLTELFDPSDRRYLYPFINCTNCGPRFSIIKSIPYDRNNTTMNEFEMCNDCRKEYTEPGNRRFHAEPVACHCCGPKIFLWNKRGETIFDGYDAVKESARLIASGKIVAFKGLGGFQLITDALSDNSIRRLRRLKQRDNKPFAVMFPSLESLKEYCDVSPHEEKLLISAEAPIVLLKSKKILADSIAPGNPYLGVMLPYTPLHHLLLNALKSPVIATSGNISDEPMCIDESEALKKLKGIADYFLIHNRKILRPVDDSIVRVVFNSPIILRRARGYAPLPMNAGDKNTASMIAVGAHLKNSIALKKNNYIFVSQQIGDLSTSEATLNFDRTLNDFKELYNVRKVCYIHDMHPDYYSTQQVIKNAGTIPVQHHIAHVASCYGENKLSGEVLGIAWDGTGLGLNNKIWGSEFFIYNGTDATHFAQLLNYSVPGGKAGVRNLINSAAAVLNMAYPEGIDSVLTKLFPEIESEILLTAIKRNINCYTTSSMGRLFDAVSALLGLCKKVTYEGQAAMMLEFCAAKGCEDYYPYQIIKEDVLLFDWRPLICEIMDDIEDSISAGIISAKFHNTLVRIIVNAAYISEKKDVVLSGGCFQNVYLLEQTIKKLMENGFNPYWNKKIPSNDSGISYGQLVYVMNHYYNSKSGKKEEQEYVSCSAR